MTMKESFVNYLKNFCSYLFIVFLRLLVYDNDAAILRQSAGYVNISL